MFLSFRALIAPSLISCPYFYMVRDDALLVTFLTADIFPAQLRDMDCSRIQSAMR